MGKASGSLIEFSIEELKKSLNDEKTIIIPTYQRGITWYEWQRKKLINSLINNYPFGCLLLHRNPNGGYRIIDGLQRSYAVIHFYDNPISYFDEDYIMEDDIEEITRLTNNDSIREDIRTDLPDLIQKYVMENSRTIDELKVLDITPMISEFVNKYPEMVEQSSKISSIIKKIIKDFISCYEKIVSTLRIPAIIFDSSEENLPEIFERINTMGSGLNKYQIAAATWSDDKVKIDNKRLSRIIDYVKARYDYYLKDIGSLEGYNSVELTRTKEVNIFDMIYGFGMMVINDYPNLFSDDYQLDLENNKIPSVGFNIINYCLLQKSLNLKNLNVSIKNIIGLDSNKICAFLINILDCIKYVNKKLNKGISFKGNKSSEKINYTLHSELQIVSIISWLFVTKYMEFDVDDRGTAKNIVYKNGCNSSWNDYKKRKFDHNVLKIYAYDLINNKWKGSGDSKLYNILVSNKYYMNDLPWEAFEGSLNNYYNTQKNERNEVTKIMNPNNVDKLIMNLVYMNILTAGDQLDDNLYDIEHLCTKQIMKSKIKKYNEIFGNEFSLPISSIGNICLLPKDYNELKGEKVMYQFKEIYNKETKKIDQFPIGKYEKKFTFTKEPDFEWLINPEKEFDDREFKELYINFLNKRFKKMKEKIKNNLYQDY